ncbi:hypothetical protein PR048_018173 [Dryococelus australis]|uniref:Uncharacterized protein n=1 Tax=Dryococelus australis TaxID=614101 RepID=A0ABQ9HBI8_9NEOP|nr:hypothetical protein PR048_018173 [Dryococelus australis]
MTGGESCRAYSRPPCRGEFPKMNNAQHWHCKQSCSIFPTHQSFNHQSYVTGITSYPVISIVGQHSESVEVQEHVTTIHNIDHSIVHWTTLHLVNGRRPRPYHRPHPTFSSSIAELSWKLHGFQMYGMNALISKVYPNRWYIRFIILGTSETWPYNFSDVSYVTINESFANIDLAYLPKEFLLAYIRHNMKSVYKQLPVYLQEDEAILNSLSHI